MNIKLIILFIFLIIPRLVIAGTMTVSGNTDDYCMSRGSTPDVFTGLVFRAPMNQGTGTAVRDVSSSQSNGTITGATWINVDGRRCLSFDGVDDDVSFGDPADGHFDFGTNSFSFMCWLKPLRIDGTNDIFLAKANTNTYSGGYSFWQTSLGKLRLEIDTTSNALGCIFNSTASLGTGTWIHAVGVVDQSIYPNAVGTLYINGVLDGTTTIVLGTGTVSNTQSLNLGKLTSGNFTNCILDDPRIYNRSLSKTEVSDIYNATK